MVSNTADMPKRRITIQPSAVQPQVKPFKAACARKVA